MGGHIVKWDLIDINTKIQQKIDGWKDINTKIHQKIDGWNDINTKIQQKIDGRNHDRGDKKGRPKNAEPRGIKKGRELVPLVVGISSQCLCLVFCTKVF